MNKLKLSFAALVMVAGLFAAPAAHAEVVLSWESDVTVSSDGSVTVRETIDYNPEDSEHHGLIREVPAELTDDSGHTYYYDIQLVTVTDERGHSVPIASQHTGRAGLYLKLGSGSSTLSAGQHFYIITYRMKPAVTHTATADRLNLNIIGTSWQIPVYSAQAKLHFPSGTQFSNKACYTGPAGSRSSECIVEDAGGGVWNITATRPLSPNEAFTVDFSAAPLGLATYLEPDKPLPFTPFEKTIFALAAIGTLLSLIGVGWLLARTIQQARARSRQTIIPIYEPPAKLTPAHLSILESPSADVADITATLLHLAVRGIIKIELVTAKTWFASANYRLTRIDTTTPLAPFEQTLVDAIFAGETSFELKNLSTRRTKLPTAIQKFRETLGQDLTKQGFFLSSPTGWLTGARWATGIGTAAAASLASGMVTSGESDILYFAAACGGTAVALGIAFVMFCRKPSGRSQAGNKEWAEVRGFKWFLEVTEKDRLNFTDAPEKTPELFSKMLPYAVALKVEKKWAKQFAGIDVTPAVSGWYVGYAAGQAFSADSFTSTFSSSFNGAMSSGFSGSTGGGFSGGGVGGGGGGSW